MINYKADCQSSISLVLILRLRCKSLFMLVSQLEKQTGSLKCMYWLLIILHTYFKKKIAIYDKNLPNIGIRTMVRELCRENLARVKVHPSTINTRPCNIIFHQSVHTSYAGYLETESGIKSLKNNIYVTSKIRWRSESIVEGFKTAVCEIVSTINAVSKNSNSPASH